MQLSKHTALPLSVVLGLDLVMLQAERPEVLGLVGIRLPAEDASGTQVVHMPRSERDSQAASRPLTGVIVAGHDLPASIFRPLPALDNQPVLTLETPLSRIERVLNLN